MTVYVKSVSRLEQEVDLKGIDKTPFSLPRARDPFLYEFYVSAEPNLEQSPLSSKAQVETNQPTWGSYTIKSDEGTMIGGKDLAPSPMAYMISGITLCYLSHIIMYLKFKPELKFSKCEVKTRMKFETLCDKQAILEDGVSGDSLGIEMKVIIESDGPREEIAKLYVDCIEACTGLQTCVKPIPAVLSLDLNGEEVMASTKNM